MSQALKSSLPSRLQKAAAPNGDGGAEFARKHHGKTQSHVVSAYYYGNEGKITSHAIGNEVLPW